MESKSIELRYALYYPTLGWAVVRLHRPSEGLCSCGDPECASPGKHPRLRGGVTSATTDPKTILGWFAPVPDSNSGINVGESGLVAIDIDHRHNGTVEDLPLTEEDRITPTVITGGGGLHLYYAAPEDVRISNSNKRLPQGIDVRAGRAYTVAPPSLHVSGRRYAWLPERAPWDLEPRPLPDALLPMLVIKREPSRCDPARVPPVTDRQTDVGRRHPYVAKALHDELDRLAQAKEGQRNDFLNSAAFSLGQFIGVGLLPRDEVETLLHNAAMVVGLEATETQKTIKSGIEAGIRNPRRNWPDWR